jgi:hypothetical protein
MAKTATKKRKAATRKPPTRTLTQAEFKALVVDRTDGAFKKSEVQQVLTAVEEAALDALAEGYKLNLMGLVIMTPRGLPARTVETFKEFGNPAAGKTRRKKGAEIRLSARPGAKAKKVLPTARSGVGAELVKEGERRLKEAEKRRKQRERESR